MTDSPAFSTRRANRAGVGILPNQMSGWIKLSFDCGLRITELRNLRLMKISATGWLYLQQGGKRQERCIWVEKLAKVTQWIVSQRIDDYLWQKSSGTAQRRGAAVFNASAVHATTAGFRNFARHAAASFATDIQRAGRYGVTGDAQPFKAVITQRYLHGLDGQMAACFEDEI